MCNKENKKEHFWVVRLPRKKDICPNSVYFLKDGDNPIEMYVSSSNSALYLVTSSYSSIRVIPGLDNPNIVPPEVYSVADFYLQKDLLNNIIGLWQYNGIKWIEQKEQSEGTFLYDIPVILSSGKSLGKYINGQTIPAAGKTFEQVMRDIAFEYVNPIFTSFSVTPQATTVEVGTTLLGTRVFNWSINLNSAVIPTVDIYDNTSGTNLLEDTSNDNSEVVTINTIKLNANNANQSWKAIGKNTNGSNINSSNFIVTSLFYKYWGAVSSYPSGNDGDVNRVYANNLSKSFKSNGSNIFVLTTGTSLNKFVVLLPPGVTITSVLDVTNLNANITSEYILSTITIKDAGGTDRVFNQYKFSPSGTYPVSANHQITTN